MENTHLLPSIKILELDDDINQSINISINNNKQLSGTNISYIEKSQWGGIPAYMINPINPGESFTINWNDTINSTITFYNVGFDNTMKLFLHNFPSATF